jgi:hypothetical protein
MRKREEKVQREGCRGRGDKLLGCKTRRDEGREGRLIDDNLGPDR